MYQSPVRQPKTWQTESPLYTEKNPPDNNKQVCKRCERYIPSLYETRFRAWAGRARNYGEKAALLERLTDGAPHLENDPLVRQARELRQKEQQARQEFHDLLYNYPLPPLQWEVLRRHYLQYQSWSQMAEDTGYSRRYLLLLHARRMRQLLIGTSHTESTRREDSPS